MNLQNGGLFPPGKARTEEENRGILTESLDAARFLPQSTVDVIFVGGETPGLRNPVFPVRGSVFRCRNRGVTTPKKPIMTIKSFAAGVGTCLLLLSPASTYARDLTALQEEFLSWKFGMFLHFNMSTFVPGGWSTGREDPLKFNPEALDIGQWADAARSAHMKYAVLTVKHTGGWCLWPSDTTEHDVALFKNYRNGKGDIVREFVDAFRSRGLKVGFYYCFPLWGKGWQNYMTLPHKDYATGKIDALGLIKAQFKELLTRYGKIDLVWIDQSRSPHGGLKPGDWLKVKNYLHELQPDCMVIANNATDLTRSDVYGYEYPYSLKLPQPGNTIPSEVCDKLNAGWFANPNGHAVPVRSADYVVNKMLLPLIHRNSNYLLNCSPERTGKLHPETVARLKEIGAMWNPEHPDQYDKELYGIQTSAVTHIPNPEQRIASASGATSTERPATASWKSSRSTASKPHSSLVATPRNTRPPN